MSIKEVETSKIVDLLERYRDDPLLSRCRECASVDEREVLRSGTTSADILRETIELKLASARRSGISVSGGDELLLRLHDLGDTQLEVYAWDTQDETLALYAKVDERVVAGCLIIGKERNEGSRG